MLATPNGVQTLQPWLQDAEAKELVAIALSSRHTSEADLALVALEGRVPDRARLAAANLRELLAAIPRTPCDMAVDARTLARVADMESEKGRLLKRCEHGTAIVVIAEGNRCLDLYLRRGRRRVYWSPNPPGETFIRPEALDAALERPDVLMGIIDIVIAMGLEFNPPMYLSLEDWHLDHAAETLNELSALFA